METHKFIEPCGSEEGKDSCWYCGKPRKEHVMFDFGLKSVILTCFNSWIIGFVDGWRGILPAGGASYSPAFFKHDSLVWEAK